MNFKQRIVFWVMLIAVMVPLWSAQRIDEKGTRNLSGALLSIIPFDALVRLGLKKVGFATILDFFKNRKNLSLSRTMISPEEIAKTIATEASLELVNSRGKPVLTYRLHLAEPFSVRFAEVRNTIIKLVFFIILAMIGVTPVFNLWLIFLASIVGPIAAIVIIDYWAFPERQLIYEDGSDPDRTVNVRALGCWAVGFLVGHFTAKYNVFCPVLNAMIITGILYYFITRQEMNSRKMKQA